MDGSGNPRLYGLVLELIRGNTTRSAGLHATSHLTKDRNFRDTNQTSRNAWKACHVSQPDDIDSSKECKIARLISPAIRTGDTVDSSGPPSTPSRHPIARSTPSAFRKPRPRNASTLLSCIQHEMSFGCELGERCERD